MYALNHCFSDSKPFLLIAGFYQIGLGKCPLWGWATLMASLVLLE